MAENIRAKLRVAKIEMANPITTAAGIADADWEELPITLRDDVVNIVEEEPEESEVFSHELDVPIDVDFSGAGQRMTGSFVKATREQLAELMGGKVADGKYSKSAKLLVLNKALRLTLRNGGEVVIPNAQGTVRMDLSVGFGGVSKFPFSFRLLQASPEWDCVIMW
jgi:hypothetical protein